MSSKKPALLFFFHTNELGGAEKSALTIIQECKRNGLNVSAVVPNDGELKKQLELSLVSVSIVNYRWWCSSTQKVTGYRIWEMVFSFFNVVRFWLINKRNQPDIVVTNTLTIPWGMMYSVLVGTPHIMLIREFGTLDFGFHFLFGYVRTMQLVNKISKHVFTNSKTMKKYFEKYIDPQKLDYMYPTVFTAKGNRGSSRRYFNSQKSLKVLVLGTLIEAKGQLQAVEALGLLAQKGYTDIELVLAGKQQSQEYLQKIREVLEVGKDSSENVHIVGHLENPFNVLREADVVLICSKNEAFGRVAVEAMLFHKGVIATESGANKELFEDGVSALLYAFGDVNALADQLEKVYKDRALLEKLGNGAFERYTNHIQGKMNAEPFLALIKKYGS